MKTLYADLRDVWYTLYMFLVKFTFMQFNNIFEISEYFNEIMNLYLYM